jgi:outer membrane protein OmpA-like peptidoglycan-associated protein
MASLLNSLTERITPDVVGRVASSLGESDASVSRGLRAGVSSVLAGLVNRTADSGAMARVYELATNRDNDLSSAGDIASSVARTMTGSSTTGGVANTLLSTLFGGRSNEVGNLVARAAGFDKQSSGSLVLSAAVPTVLGFLGKRIRERSLGIPQFTSMLSSQRDSILEAAPTGLLNLLDTEPAPRAGAREYRREETAVPAPATERRGGMGWLWPLLGGAAALWLLWAVLGRNRTPETVATATDSALTAPRAALDSPAAAARRTIDTAAGAVSGAMDRLGNPVRRTLPGGVALTVPENGIESRLIGFIEDASSSVNDATWFDFDRLNFATGSATILPESEEQLNNIASILEAYPDVRVRIGGYTDSTGNAAANMRLSQQRADAVRQTLIAKGVSASRITAEGYGASHPVADNATEEGRAKNRRISVRVTAK